MKELEIQKYLRNGGTFENLISQYGVYTKPHSVFPQIILFTYDMIEGKFAERLVQECRGIILDSSRDYNVLAYPYDKFWEEDNVLADKIDWASARVLEKADGSLCTLWFNPYSDQWEVATRGTPDASGQLGWHAKTFKQHFWDTWNKLGYQLPEHPLLKSVCYMFELCTLENKVIVVHQEPRIILHGIRTLVPNLDYQEMPHDSITGLNGDTLDKLFKWELIKTYKLQTLEEVLAACEKLDPINAEGFVVVDKNFKRIKCKSIQYKALSHIKDGMGPKRIVEMVRQNSADTFTKYFPEYLELYDDIKVKYDALVAWLENSYEINKHIISQKEFALAIKELPFTGALFSLRTGRVKSIQEYLKDININNLVEFLT